MKSAILSTLLTLVATLTVAGEERHQSFVSYDDGGTVIRSAEGGRELEVHRNTPVYPGDEVITARRGRAEIRLSDGNIIGIDRTTAVRFRSILDSYEGDGTETVVELRNGKVAVHRTDLGRDHVRLDTDMASYVAQYEAIYSVETTSRGNDRVVVFQGSVEVRTPTRATRLRAGESASVDDQGPFDLVGDQRDAADDFERWFLRRAERFDGFSSRYVDRRLGYWADDLDDHGRWVFVTGIGWSWRPFVAVGWRPYYNGYWQDRFGCLTWVSYDPWGWGTYHYGRWAYDPGFGWVWVPGYGYSPAWVYWAFGPGYAGWAPAGWWDCHRPYYNWAYQPYRNYGSHGFGFYGRVSVRDFDLRPWTFVEPGTLISHRVDRAALKTDMIKQRLSRSPGGWANLSGGAARFTREELRDPAEAIRRRSLDGRYTGEESGAPPTDVTPFIRRDGDLTGAVRERINRVRGGSGAIPGGTTPATRGSIGSVAPIGGGSVAPIGRGSVAPITGAAPSAPPAQVPATGGIDRRRDGGSGRIDRGGSTPAAPTEPATRDSGSGRSRVIGRGTRTPQPPAQQPEVTTPAAPTPPAETPPPTRRNDSWRGRPSNGSGGEAIHRDSGSAPSASSGSSDVPRRVIDRIGGARIRPSEGRSGSSTRSSERSGSRERTVRSGSSDRGSRSSGGSSTRSSGGSSGGGSSSGGSSTRSSGGGSGSSSSSGGSRSSGGQIRRDQ